MRAEDDCPEGGEDSKGGFFPSDQHEKGKGKGKSELVRDFPPHPFLLAQPCLA